MDLKGMTLDHDFYVVVGKQCRTETNVILLFICFKLVLSNFSFKFLIKIFFFE